VYKTTNGPGRLQTWWLPFQRRGRKDFAGRVRWLRFQNGGGGHTSSGQGGRGFCFKLRGGESHSRTIYSGNLPHFKWRGHPAPSGYLWWFGLLLTVRWGFKSEPQHGGFWVRVYRPLLPACWLPIIMAASFTPPLKALGIRAPTHRLGKEKDLVRDQTPGNCSRNVFVGTLDSVAILATTRVAYGDGSELWPSP